MHDAIIISDLHLGSENCQAKRLCDFLETVAAGGLGGLATRKLILNGDVFDSFDFRRLKKKHWKALSLLRKLSDDLDIIWLCGNHDGTAEMVSHLLGVTVKDEYVLPTGSEQLLILHGHVFDSFIDEHPILTWLGDAIYFLLQRIDRTHTFAKWAKRSSKTFLHCANKIETGSIEAARKRNCTAVCCGHTHQAVARREGDVHYFNSGCWTEAPGTYVTVTRGAIQVHAFGAEMAAESEDRLVPTLLAS
jgi:UDP-2,3-diacylglucosamine pyrophosphatase LpxH